jgi:hypothetical protein
MSDRAMPSYDGTCHCGALGFRYRTALPPASWPVRACQCSFCRLHSALSTSDPAGLLEFVERATGAHNVYRFGRKITDFLLCRHCGAYLGAAMQAGGKRFGIVNARVLLALAADLPAAVPMSYDGEDAASRTKRREARWTPVTGETWWAR